MFDLGWTELLVIGIVALIVVGPKDLPVLFRNVGRFVGKAKGMAREFSSAMHEAAEESGVNEMTKGLKSATNPVASAMDGVKDAARDLSNSLNPAKLDPTKYDPESETGKLAAKRAESAATTRAQATRVAAGKLEREASAAETDRSTEPESKS